MKNILIIAAHPDDEVLGCGGTISKFSKLGYNIHVLIAAGRNYNDNTKQADYADKACALLGVNELCKLNLKDQLLDDINSLDLTQLIERKISSFNPQIVFVHHHNDVNTDHTAIFRATITACRPTGGNSVKEIYSYETLSSTEWGYPRNFIPDVWVDISQDIDAKIKAIECYKLELRDYPHPRSLKSIINKSKFRGSEVSISDAECFMTVRRIIS